MDAFLAAPIDLRIKNLFRISTIIFSEKNVSKSCVKVCTKPEVSQRTRIPYILTKKCIFISWRSIFSSRSADVRASLPGNGRTISKKTLKKLSKPLKSILNILIAPSKCISERELNESNFYNFDNIILNNIYKPPNSPIASANETFYYSYTECSASVCELNESNLYKTVVILISESESESIAIHKTANSHKCFRMSPQERLIERTVNLRVGGNDRNHEPATRTKVERIFTLRKVKEERLTRRHKSALIFILLQLSADVEKNPGPQDHEDEQHHRTTSRRRAQLKVMSYNVRGLNDEKKLRHLINHLYKEDPGKNGDFIVCLQETYLERESKVPYLWRGNFHLTPGLGNSQGCITLLSPHISVVESRNIGNRAHVLACQKSGETQIGLLVVNIYAPNPNNLEKFEFFEAIFDVLDEFETRHNCTNSIVVGDFNVVFNENEAKNRLYSAQEKRIATSIKDRMRAAGLTDLWEDKALFTWKRANSESFSAIDRILFKKNKLIKRWEATNWSLSFSDHAALEAGFDYVGINKRPRTKITRLDPSLVKIPECRAAIEREYQEMLNKMIDGWDPHLKLEYAKMCIRTVVEKVQAERKKFEQTEEDNINEELNCAVESLAAGRPQLSGGSLVDYIEELRSKKAKIIEDRGSRLADKLKTKWYNEGEKSNKYFLGLLRRNMPDDFKTLIGEEGELLNDPEEIESAIVTFYKKLYEGQNEVEITEDDNFLDEIISISDEEGDEIVTPVTPDELRKTLHTCKDSSPGPDGIPYSILGLLWPTFGKILSDAWNHSLQTGKLPPSHKASFLKLIPKAGKDLNKLTNWRPITLSNCDHKLITKTYSMRMCKVLTNVIGEKQTAYLKGRLINDNIRSMLATINLAGIEDNIDGLIVALDAKKAFDSVDHKYIERCLISFGCRKFVPIFKILYKELTTDIIINGKVVKGFDIRRGVKQGDALSCILFIMCMEPLIRNIDKNDNITPLYSTNLESAVPKAFAYADDINCVIKDSESNLQRIFKEYERLTRNSGLQLNAEKTEILRIGKNPPRRTYNVTYLELHHEIKSSDKMKINGIIFQRDYSELVKENVKNAIARMDSIFRSWSRRSLSTLGKIVIVKTFGLSQIIYILQTLALTNNEYKMINNIVYKFIWNRHYLAAKAPERIRREIVVKTTRQGGLGMLDVMELDSGLKLRALGRLLDTKHPFLQLIRAKVDLTEFFNPICRTNLERVATAAIGLLKAERSKLWGKIELNNNSNLLSAIRQMDIRLALTNAGKNSIPLYMLWRRNIKKIGDLDVPALGSIRRYIEQEKLDKIDRAVNVRIGNRALGEQFYVKNVFKSLADCTSKELRESLKSNAPVTNLKFGNLDLEVNEALSWYLKLSKLSSTRHKNTLLRIIHGDIYTKDRLHRFGMIDNPNCPRCDEVETLTHKLIECEYVRRIWQRTLEITNRIPEPDMTRLILAIPTIGTTLLTLHAEILQRILYLREDTNYLVHPRVVVNSAIKDLIRKETKTEIKNVLKDLLL